MRAGLGTRRAALGAALATTAVLGAADARAATLTVTSLADSGPGTLREAVAAANQDAPADTIVLPSSGTITLASQLVVSTAVTIDSPGAVTVTRDASAGRFRLFLVNGSGSLTLRDVTLTNGSPPENNALGGAIAGDNASVTLERVVVRDNEVNGPLAKGGGVWVSGAGALTVVDSRVTGNEALATTGNAQGGGIWAPSPSISTSTVDGNLAAGPEAYGGGVAADNMATLVTTTVSGNDVAAAGAASGGGVFVQGLNGLTATAVTFADNGAPGAGAHVAGVHTIESSVMGPTPGAAAPCAGFTVDAGANVFAEACGMPGGASVVADPLLLPLADLGGRTPTHGLRTGSPAIDFGRAVRGADQRGVDPVDAPVADANGSPVDSGAFELDDLDPPTTVVGGVPALGNDPTPTFTLAAGEPATFECALDGGPFVACAADGTFTAAPLADGPHSFTARGTDRFGNVESAGPSLAFTVDTTPPAVAFSSGPPTETTDTTATFAFAAEPGATFLCAVDGAAASACVSPFTVAGLGAGPHTFAVTAADALGNASATATRAWTVLSPPAPPGPVLPGPALPGAASAPLRLGAPVLPRSIRRTTLRRSGVRVGLRLRTIPSSWEVTLLRGTTRLARRTGRVTSTRDDDPVVRLRLGRAALRRLGRGRTVIVRVTARAPGRKPVVRTRTIRLT